MLINRAACVVCCSFTSGIDSSTADVHSQLRQSEAGIEAQPLLR